MLRECLVGFRHCDRYAAHGKIDDALRQFPRENLRTWHSSVIQAGPDVFSGSIRTKSDAIVEAMPQAKWREVHLPKEGEVCDAIVEVAPKRPKQYGAFRTPQNARDYVREKLEESGAFESFEHTLISQSMVEVRKPGCQYTSPSAWFRVTGTLKSRDAYEKLVLHGIGGGHSFGIGLLNPEGSALYAMAKAVAHAHAPA